MNAVEKSLDFAWGAKGHEFESHYSDQKNRRSKTTVFSLSKVPEMLKFRLKMQENKLK